MGSQLFQQGFASLDHEAIYHRLPVEGQIPAWLAGTLVRNGPAKFDLGQGSVRHWFDGFAMLHAFTFQQGSVAYANRFLRGQTFKQANAEGRLSFSAFTADPCRSLFGRFFSVLFNDFDNANVSVARLADRFVALTETPLAVEFDPHTLETLGALTFDQPVPGDLTTAHPLYDARRDALLNYTLRFGLVSSYNFYWLRGRALESLSPLWTLEPAYMHSFNMSERYAILSIFPFTVQPIDLLANLDKPFIGCFRWQPQRSTKFLVVDKELREPTRIYEAEATFGFHHVNAFETEDGLMVDLICYSDPSIIDLMYLDRLRDSYGMPVSEVRRYHLPRSGTTASYERISPEGIELPQFNEQTRGKNYRYIYGVGAGSRLDFMNRLVKVDVQRRAAKGWSAAGCYPGEPVFVPSPGGQAEDSGVVLSVVLDVQAGNSFLLVLDAASFEEVGRAIVPHHIPFGFHGAYFEDVA